MRAPDLGTIDQYRRLFMDASYWSPFVKAVCDKHGLRPAHNIRTGDVPGTYPVFIVDDKWIVKFFGTLFDGEHAFSVELEVSHLLSARRDLPSPALIAHGYLLDESEGCRWPYLVFEFVKASSLSQVSDRLLFDEKIAMARTLGTMARRLHSVDLHGMMILKPTWDAYHAMLQRQSTDCTARHRNWGSLPERLIGQIDEFLLSPEELFDHHNQPALLHGDLTADHVLVIQDGTDWRLRAIIDFGDAIVGDPMYELVALHFDIFRCDKLLLREYLLAYGYQDRFGREVARKLLSLCLLFPYDAFHNLLERFPAASTVSDLNELADWLWEIDNWLYQH